MSQSSLATTRIATKEARRSTRIDKCVPLIVLGQNRVGEPFMERTSSVSLNMHGCRYPSRHDYGVGSWVTLQVVALNDPDQKPAEVRAQVRSVHAAASLRELHQVGVEFEIPANVWGIAPPPSDWLQVAEGKSAVTQAVTVAVPSEESTAANETWAGPANKSEEKSAEVATFPSPTSSESQLPSSKAVEHPRPPRVVISPDGLMAAIQRKLQQEAEKAAQAAVGKQVNEAVRVALQSIDNVRQSTIREVQEVFPKRLEVMRHSLKRESANELFTQWKEHMEAYRDRAEEMAQRLEKQAADLRHEIASAQEYVEKTNREIAPQIQGRVNEAVARAASDLDGTAARVVDRQYERLLENVQSATQEALLKLDARSSEVQALVQTAVNSGLATFQRQAELHVKTVLAETRERAVSALSSLDAETRATCDARREALEAEVTRSAERSTEQFRKGMKAFLYSCLVAAVSAVDEHSKSTLDGLLKENGKTLLDTAVGSLPHNEQEIVSNGGGESTVHERPENSTVSI